MRTHRTYILAASAIVLGAAGLACRAGAAAPDASFEDAFAATSAVLDLELTREALEDAQTAGAMPAPTSPTSPVPPAPAAPAGEAPAITRIVAPQVIPSTGEKVPATIIFTDIGEDVVNVKFKVISAECCIQDSTLDVTTRTAWEPTGGVITFELTCDAPQSVTLT
jgi:hypothetical protein